MLIAGLTVLSGRLGPLEFSLYWLGCLLATGLAIVAAFRELRALQRQSLEEQHRLFQATLEQIAREARTKAQHGQPGPGRAASPQPGNRE